MGERVELREPLLDDAGHADRWYFGEDAADEGAVRRALQNRESIPWGGNSMITLVIMDLVSRKIPGGVLATRSAHRTCRREHILRPQGRVDLLQLERVNREWGRHAR